MGQCGEDGKSFLNWNTLVMNLIENQGGFSSLERGTMVVANGQRGFHGLVVFLISSDKVLGSLIMKSRDRMVVTALSEKLVMWIQSALSKEVWV